MLRLFVLLAALLASAPAQAQAVESFAVFLARFESTAVAAGIRPSVYRAAMLALTPDPDIPDLVVTQPEFTTPIWDYLDNRVSKSRISRGKAAFAANKDLLTLIGERYRVDPYILAAIWGIETDYGAVLSNSKLIRPVIRSLATLVHQRRGRLKQDEADLIAALKLVQDGPLTAETLVGSWAGAIGHLQVNPSNVIAHGMDGDGDGSVDLQNSLADALATSAKFLRDLGYEPGVDWGMEVTVPETFDYLQANRDSFRPVSFFADQGIKRVKGKAFADPSLPVFLYAPAGKDGPKFLMTRNYLVLKGYNFSDSYALSVAHLTDRLKGAGSFVDDWPRKTKFPNLQQRIAIQEALKRTGLYQGEMDGRIGPDTQAAYARFQARSGEIADGFITLASYDELVAATR